MSQPPRVSADTTVVRPHPVIPGVTVIAAQHTPGPTLVLVGSVHGNEPCGRVALERLVREAESGQFELARGTLYVVHGNPEATRLGKRHTPGGHDLNRLFDFRFLDTVPERSWGYEHRRALALRPLLEEADAILDLHSTTKPSQPFVILPPNTNFWGLGLQLGLKHLTYGWESPGLIAHCVLVAVATRRNKPGLSVECGQHDDPQAIEVAWHTLRRFLAAYKVDGSAQPGAHPAADSPVWLRIHGTIKKPSDGFAFQRVLQGLDALPRGEVIGRDDYVEIRASRDAIVIMPNDSVEVGQDALYLATVEAPEEPVRSV